MLYLIWLIDEVLLFELDGIILFALLFNGGTTIEEETYAVVYKLEFLETYTFYYFPKLWALCRFSN